MLYYSCKNTCATNLTRRYCTTGFCRYCCWKDDVIAVICIVLDACIIHLHMVCHAQLLCRFEPAVHSPDIAREACNGRHEAGPCEAWAGWAPWAEIGARLETDGRPQHCRPLSTECHASAQKLQLTSEVCLSLLRGAFAYIKAGQISAAPSTARSVVKTREYKHQPFRSVRTIPIKGHLHHR